MVVKVDDPSVDADGPSIDKNSLVLVLAAEVPQAVFEFQKASSQYALLLMVMFHPFVVEGLVTDSKAWSCPALEPGPVHVTADPHSVQWVPSEDGTASAPFTSIWAAVLPLVTV